MKTIPKLQNAWSRLLYNRPITLDEYVSGDLNTPEYWLPNVEVVGEYNLDNENLFPWEKRKIEIDRRNRNEKRLAGEYYSRIPDSQNVAQIFHNTFQALRHGYNGWVDPESSYNSGEAPTPGRARIKIPKVQYFNGKELGKLLFPNRKSVADPFNEKVFRVGVNLRPRSKNPQITISTGNPRTGNTTNYDFNSNGTYRGFSIGYEKSGGNIIFNQEGNKINDRADYSKPNKKITATLNGKKINLTVNEGQLYGEDPINVKGQNYYLTGDSTLIRSNQNKDINKKIINNKIVKDQQPAEPLKKRSKFGTIPGRSTQYGTGYSGGALNNTEYNFGYDYNRTHNYDNNTTTVYPGGATSNNGGISRIINGTDTTYLVEAPPGYKFDRYNISRPNNYEHKVDKKNKFYGITKQLFDTYNIPNPWKNAGGVR